MKNVKIENLLHAIKSSDTEGQLLTLGGVTGLSGQKLIGLLQRCARVIEAGNDECYVEVGVYQGLTLTSVAASEHIVPCFGIDDFSQFDPNGENQKIVQERLEKHTKENAQLINGDFEDVLLDLGKHVGGKKVALYFVDGPHDYRSQYLSLEYVRPWLAKNSIIVVDDSNYEHVRRANSDFLRGHPEFALAFEAYTSKHPKNIEKGEEDEFVNGWWNGVNVIVHDPDGALERIYPQVSQSRELYFNDHFVHASRYAESAPKLLRASSLPLPRAALALFRFLMNRPKSDRFRGMNTNSLQLEKRTAMRS